MGARAAFVYHDGYLRYDFGPSHPMRQTRIALARHLTKDLGLLDGPGVQERKPDSAAEGDILGVHSSDYVEAVRRLGKPGAHFDPGGLLYGLGIADNPVFEGMYDAAALHTGGTILCTDLVVKGDVDHAFSPGGGFHHAMRSRASGFCIFNDPAVALRRLVDHRGIRRALYVDIDAHHGDGVQAAFYSDPRVLTISLHEDGRYLFPGTGFVDELGESEGRGYSVNVPLPPYTHDEAYLHAFREVVPPLARAYRPEVLFSQMGVDTHFTDPLTHFRLTTHAYRELFRELHTLAHEVCGGRWVGVGGGGYDPEAVARAWTLAFAEMASRSPGEKLPAGYVDLCRQMLGRGPEGEAIDDPVQDTSHVVPQEVREVVAEVRTRIFPYHHLA